jgi:hypothetical protein
MILLRYIIFSLFLKLLHSCISSTYIKFAFICTAAGLHDDDSEIRMEI